MKVNKKKTSEERKRENREMLLKEKRKGKTTNIHML